MALVGCLSPSPPDGELGCDPSGACPTGYFCASNRTCYKNGSVAPDGGNTGALAVDPPMRNFGTIVSGTKSAAGRFTVTNNDAAATGTLMIEVTGAQAADFVTQSDNCTSVSLVAHGTCTVDVVFQPRATTLGAAAATITISGTPGGSTSAQLSGMAVAPGALTLTPTSNDFMKVETGKTSAEVVFTVKNTGGAASGSVTAALSGSDMDQFTLASDCA